MERPTFISEAEALKHDPLFRDVLSGNEWAVNFLNELEIHDQGTLSHSGRVARLFLSLSATDKESEEIYEAKVLAGLLHDVGKTTIDPEVLNKQGPLSETEREIIKGHARAGYESVVSYNPLAARILVAHHEFQQDSYPRAEIRENMESLYSRDLALADGLDARLYERPYREKSIPEAEVQEDLSRHFPEDRVRAGIATWKSFNSHL